MDETTCQPTGPAGGSELERTVLGHLVATGRWRPGSVVLTTGPREVQVLCPSGWLQRCRVKVVR